MPENPDDPQKKFEKQEKTPEQKIEHKPSTPAHEPALEPAKMNERAQENELALQDAKDQLGLQSREKPAEAPAREPAKLTLAEVRTKEDFRQAMDVMKNCFTDPTDLETNRTFCRFFFSPELASYTLIKDGDKPIGVELIRINPNVPGAMYVPYAGMYKGPDTNYRSKGIYPKAMALSDQQMRERGNDHVVYEFEDKRVLEAGVYADEKPEDVLRRVEGRQNFWKRSAGCIIINDEQVPYCRPASDDTNKTQAYDSLAFRVLDESDPKWQGLYNGDKTAISREHYEKFYLEIMQLEYGSKDSVPSKEELRRDYPAIEQFFKQLEANPEKKWISIDTKGVRQKATPDTDRGIEMRDNVIDQRERWKQVPKKGEGWEEPLREAA